jgi:hypothetical protein
MALCDVCMNSTSFEDGTVFKPVPFRSLNKKGSDILERKITALMEKKGRDRGSAIDEFETFLRFNEPWLLCPDCSKIAHKLAEIK